MCKQVFINEYILLYIVARVFTVYISAVYIIVMHIVYNLLYVVYLLYKFTTSLLNLIH